MRRGLEGEGGSGRRRRQEPFQAEAVPATFALSQGIAGILLDADAGVRLTEAEGALAIAPLVVDTRGHLALLEAGVIAADLVA